MKSRIVLFAFCLALLSSCGNKGNDTGKVPEYAVQELQKINCKSNDSLSGYN